MKIKNYKLFIENVDTLTYKVGDYVLVNSEDYDLYNTLMIIDDKIEDDDGVFYACRKPNMEYEFYEVNENEIIRKLSDMEIKGLKYNL